MTTLALLETVACAVVVMVPITAVIVWRVKVSLDKWADGMLAAFPEILQSLQKVQAEESGRIAEQPAIHSRQQHSHGEYRPHTMSSAITGNRR
jgi:hypothetical protein